ncbi:MAG: ATP-dependent DNA helicase PcrA, partial [Planctomycetota bacterium]
MVALGENFRSTQAILAAADALIQRNTQRKAKPLIPTRTGGQAPAALLCADELDEADAIARWIRQLREREGLRYGDVALCVRVNALSRTLEEALRREGTPYVVARGAAFYEREEVRDALAYLRLVANPADDAAFARIVNKPARGLGAVALRRVEALARERDAPLYEALRQACAPDNPAGLTDRARKAAGRFVDFIEEVRQGDEFLGQEAPEQLAQLVERVLRDSGLERHYATAKKRGQETPDEEKLENLAELVSAASQFDVERFEAQRGSAAQGRAEDDLPPQLADDLLAPAEQEGERTLLGLLRAFLESIALVSDADRIDPSQGAVTIMTLHAAKGLEFPAVAIVGLEEGLLPHARSAESPDELEEERRLLFVGMTRAKDHLLLTTCVFRTHRGLRERRIPSAFLEEMSGLVEQRRTETAAAGLRDPLERLTDTAGAGPGGQRAGRRVVSEAEEQLEAMGVKPGARVRHQRFGEGVVEQVL